MNNKNTKYLFRLGIQFHSYFLTDPSTSKRKKERIDKYVCARVCEGGEGTFENIKSVLYYFNSPLSNKLDMQYEILIGRRPAQQNVYIATLNGVR